MIEANIQSIVSHIVPQALRPLVGIDKIENTYATLRAMGGTRPLTDRLLDCLKVTCRVSEEDIANIPRKGPAILVVNHPFGILEGAVMATLARRARPDVKILANGVLASIPEMRDLMIPVDPMGDGKTLRGNPAGLRSALGFLRNGGLLVMFPAGEVSHFQWRLGEVTDPEWNPAAARMVEILARKNVSVPIVPAFVDGANSLSFQLAGMLHARLRTAMLARELFNKAGRSVEVRIGSPVESAKLLSISTHQERTDYLRWRTYLLAKRNAYKPRTAQPLFRRRAATLEPVASPADPALLALEVAFLPPERRLAVSGALAVYLAPADEIPHVLEEIGRLREITFRAAGEGTGQARDLDRFDRHYQHLFLWNESRREIAGAYRLSSTDGGPAGLYTATLFDYGEEFLARMGPALELGRSFIRAEYQKGFTPLLLLWKGIGRHVAHNPRYRTLFGPVSISNRYQAISRELMVAFLERYAALPGWAGLVTERNPLRRRFAAARSPQGSRDLDALSDAVSDLEPDRAGVPVLLRQYLRLGGKLLGFNVDPEFAAALDGLILVNLDQTEPKLLERYLGQTEAQHFLASHERNLCTHEHFSSSAGHCGASPR